MKQHDSHDSRVSFDEQAASSGKSTLLRILSGQLPSTEGAILAAVLAALAVWQMKETSSISTWESR